MKLIIGGENGLSYLERMAYNGVIGLFYENMWTGLLVHIIVIILIIFALIGVIATLKFLLFGKKKSKS